MDLFANLSLGASFAAQDRAVLFLRFAAFIAIGIYFVMLPCLGSKKSYWDALAANKLIKIIRVVVFFEVLAMLLLLYCTISLGPPLVLNAFTSYGNGDSWLYGYGRAISGLITVFAGAIGDMHPIARLVCLFGAVGELVGDALSSFQVDGYLTEHEKSNAPLGHYNIFMMNLYFYRDIASFGLCLLLLFTMGHFTCLTGFCSPSLLSYQTIAGGELDRCEVMRQQRKLYKAYLSQATGDDDPDADCSGGAVLDQKYPYVANRKGSARRFEQA